MSIQLKQSFFNFLGSSFSIQNGLFSPLPSLQTSPSSLRTNVKQSHRGSDEIATSPFQAPRYDKVLDLTKLVVVPGFIDCHAHSDYFLLMNHTADAKVYQGVTTDIGGNCGYSAAPVWGSCQAKRIEDYEKYESLKLPWSSLSEYFKTLKKLHISMNYAHLVGHNTLRESETGVVNRKLTQQEIKNICSKLEEAFHEGAIGLSTGLVYPPACYADEKELLELGKMCKKHGKIFAFHMRNENDLVLEAISETLNVGRKTGCKIQISHLKTFGKRNWNKIDKVFDVIETAIKEGVDVMCDRYPYTAAQTGLQQVLPSWVYDGGEKKLIQNLKDIKFRKDIHQELSKKYDSGYYDTVQIMEVPSQKNKKYEGKRVSEAAQKLKVHPLDFVMDLLIQEETKVSAIYHAMSEENLERILKKEYVMIGSDSGCRSCEGRLSKGALHPRAFGTFPRVISEYVKKKKILTLEEAVKKMTVQPAERFGLAKRGKIKAGYYADLVAFDYEKLQDTSTFLDPLHYPKGIEYVFVNGEMVIKKGKHTKKTPGMTIKI
ncbi:MAG: D-aminoacylase [Deltaproteobacteria bacterium]|nr:D-aminoacylase [Deltaproteobacteria bacterium]